MRAHEFLREDVENFPIANVRRPNGAIGNQGVNTEQAADVLTHAAGMQVSPDWTMRQLVDALRADPAAQQRLRQFVQKNPITVSALPDGSYHLLDGHHRTFLLNLLGDETVPAIVKEGVAEGLTEAAMSNAVTFFRGEPILSQERLNQLKSSIGKPYPILRKEGSAANIGTYMSPDGKKATSFVQQALAGQGTGGTVTQIQVDPNSFSKGDGGIDEAVIITNIAGLVSDQKPNENDPLRIQDRKQAMLKYLGPGVQKYLNDPLLTNPNLVQRWYNPEFAQKNWNTINSGKQAVTKPGESEIQERMISVLGSLAEKIRRDPEVISYFIEHNPGNWIEYNFRMNSDGSGTKVVDVKYYPPAKQGVAENFADGRHPGRKVLNPDVYEDLANSIIARIARQIVPTIRAKQTPEGYVYLKTADGLSLVIGCSIADGSIGINIGTGHETTSSGPHKGAITEIVQAVYAAAVKHYGTPSQPGSLSVDHDAGHGVWQHIAQKLGLEYAAHMVKENFADGRHPEDKGDSKRHGIPKHATMAELEKASHADGRKGQLARWQLNMRRGHKK